MRNETIAVGGGSIHSFAGFGGLSASNGLARNGSFVRRDSPALLRRSRTVSYRTEDDDDDDEDALDIVIDDDDDDRGLAWHHSEWRDEMECDHKVKKTAIEEEEGEQQHISRPGLLPSIRTVPRRVMVQEEIDAVFRNLVAGLVESLGAFKNRKAMYFLRLAEQQSREFREHDSKKPRSDARNTYPQRTLYVETLHYNRTVHDVFRNEQFTANNFGSFPPPGREDLPLVALPSCPGVPVVGSPCEQLGFNIRDPHEYCHRVPFSSMIMSFFELQDQFREKHLDDEELFAALSVDGGGDHVPWYSHRVMGTSEVYCDFIKRWEGFAVMDSHVCRFLQAVGTLYHKSATAASLGTAALSCRLDLERGHDDNDDADNNGEAPVPLVRSRKRARRGDKKVVAAAVRLVEWIKVLLAVRRQHVHWGYRRRERDSPPCTEAPCAVFQQYQADYGFLVVDMSSRVARQVGLSRFSAAGAVGCLPSWATDPGELTHQQWQILSSSSSSSSSSPLTVEDWTHAVALDTGKLVASAEGVRCGRAGPDTVRVVAPISALAFHWLMAPWEWLRLACNVSLFCEREYRQAYDRFSQRPYADLSASDINTREALLRGEDENGVIDQLKSHRACWQLSLALESHVAGLGSDFMAPLLVE